MCGIGGDYARSVRRRFSRSAAVRGTALRRCGYAVDVSGDGEDGLWRAENTDYDVIVLDLMLPKLDGLSVLQRLREAGRLTHVLLLTARDSVADRIRGLKAGADDYLVKPFALEELLARVEALCRRAYGHKQNRLIAGDVEMDTAAKQVWRKGHQLKLKPREYQLLEYLIHRRGEVVTQERSRNTSTTTAPSSSAMSLNPFCRRFAASSARPILLR